MKNNEDKLEYFSGKLEKVPCNLCGGQKFAILARKNKCNLPVTTCMCGKCGLIFINPRMTKGDYDEYYKYFYRKDRAEVKNKEGEGKLDFNWITARKLGNAIGNKFGKYFSPGLTVDVGSSTGGILFGLRETVPGIEALGIEPSLLESEYARKKGIRTETVMFENYKENEKEVISNVICVKSLNHLLDPMSFLKWSHDRLVSGGRIFLAVKDFRFQARRSGGDINSSVQIDHPYMFTPETLKLFVEKAGFKVLYLDSDEQKSHEELKKQREDGLNVHHTRIIAEKADGLVLSQRGKIFEKLNYLKLRFQFYKPILKVYYYLFYSKRSLFSR